MKILTVLIYQQLQTKPFTLMNLLNLQVKIKKIKIKTNEEASLSFSLRLGRLLSPMSPPVVNRSHSNTELNIDLNIGCQDNIISSNSRACLVIYELGNIQHRDIIGMVFILLKNTQGQIQRYRIQQCSDPNSFVQLSFSVTNLQVQQKQNQSFASKSSLAQIKQLHRVLSRGHKKTGSDLSYDVDEHKKARLSPQEKEREPKSRNPNKITHIKSQQSVQFRNEENEPSYAMILKKLQQELSKERQRNSVLTNLLVIEQTKNNQSQRLLSSIMATFKSKLSSKHEKNGLRNQKANNTQSCEPKLTRNVPHNQIEGKEQAKKTQAKINAIASSQSNKYDTIAKQRDQLYKISQQLYEKTKVYKAENENLFNNVKSVQNQLKLCMAEIEDLRQENIELKSKLFQNQEQQFQIGNSNTLRQLSEQNQRIKKENIQYERKFKESYRAIQQFKNDAWKAQEELIVKDKQIASLKQELQTAKMHENKHQQRSQSGSYIEKDERQQKKSNLDMFKFLSALIIKNNLDRQRILDRLTTPKPGSEQSKVELLAIINKLKQNMLKLYQQYERYNIKTIQVLEMKRKVTMIINQLNF